MIQQEFAERVTRIIRNDRSVIGLAVAGSWLTNEIDEFSDLDLILVNKEKISGNTKQMIDFANQMGELLSAFTGEHVGEPRLLICLYNNPLLHVDIKFLTLEEFPVRIENPVILFDTDNVLQKIINKSEAKFPFPDYQWIEDRFWIWVHYALLKIGRGEYFEALDFLSFLRATVLGPLLHIKNKNLPRGVRKVEIQISNQDLQSLKSTVATHNKQSILGAVNCAIILYIELRDKLFSSSVIRRKDAEVKVREFFIEIEEK